MQILVTGGAGYIGSHTVVELLNAGYEVLILDNFDNSNPKALQRVKKITSKTLRYVEGDVRDSRLLDEIFKNNKISAVLHFAGLKAVGESVRKPLEYFDVNVTGTVQLCKAMEKAGVYTFVFSSSATVYGDPDQVPIREDFPTKKPTNPYGETKLIVEDMLRDLYLSNSAWKVALLRYFNPVGAHESGLIGESPNDIPNNLMPYISQVAVGRLEKLSVYGNDYPTPDGTGVRDYVHVVDLAVGHVAALVKLEKLKGVQIWNLGTGQGYSVLEMLKAFEEASGCSIPCEVVSRRDGDIAECYTSTEKAEKELAWKAERGLDKIMEDTWRWQSNNPNGYEP